jgi:hypothetical protein
MKKKSRSITLLFVFTILVSLSGIAYASTPLQTALDSNLHIADVAYGNETSMKAQTILSLHRAVYLAPSSNQFTFPRTLMARSNIRLVSTTAQLEKWLQANPNTKIIYIHSMLLSEVTPAFLQGEYDKGHLIVAVNAPISSLASRIVMAPDLFDPAGLMPDIGHSNTPSSGILISVYQSLSDPGKGIRGYLMLSDVFYDVNSVPYLLSQMVDRTPSVTEPSSDSPIGPLASAGVWTDSTGGQLYGHTYTSKSGGNYWGHGYTDYVTAVPYFQTLRVKTFNNCGYWHQISDSNIISQSYPSGPTETSQLMGSTQCGSSFKAESTHESQRYPSYSTYISGTTDKSCTGANC